MIEGPSNGPFYFSMKIIVLLFVFVSCSYLPRMPWQDNSKKLLPPNYEYMGSTDYLDHINSLGESFLKSKNINIVSVSKKNQEYLKNIIGQIISNNGNIFKVSRDYKVYIVSSSSPFYFGLPNGKIFLSIALLKKYLTNENLLAIVIAQELMRIEKRIYPKTSIIPVGYMPVERLVNFSRMPFEERVELNKWVFYITRRAGFDSQEVLSFIQLRNKNSLDFTMQIGDGQQVAREESMFKNFLIKQVIDNGDRKKTNSSKEFYNFSNEVERYTT